MPRFICFSAISVLFLFLICTVVASALVNPKFISDFFTELSSIKNEPAPQGCSIIVKNGRLVCECCGDASKTNSLVDASTIIRIVLSPIILWILKNLISYSFQRIHVIRSIYVDVDYRMRFTEMSVKAGKEWLADFDVTHPRIPLLGISQEDHQIYPTIQGDLRETTWGAEVAAVRLIYRAFDDMENAAGRAVLAFQELLRVPSSDRTQRQRLRDRIEVDLSVIERSFLFWSRVGRRERARFRLRESHARGRWWFKVWNVFFRKERPTERYTWVARALFYEPVVWHALNVYLPVIILGASVVLLIFLEDFSWLLIGALVILVSISALLEWVLFRKCKKSEDARIEMNSLEANLTRMKEYMQKKNPPTYV